MQGSAGTSHGYPAFQSSHSLSHSLSSYWTGICYLAGSSCQILFWVHNLSCSLFLVFHFPFLCVFCLSCISILASPLLLKPKSCLLGDHLHRSSTLLLLLDWIPPPPPNSQIFGKNQLTGFQEASTPLSKSTKTNPCRQSGKTKKKKRRRSPHALSKADVEKLYVGCHTELKGKWSGAEYILIFGPCHIITGGNGACSCYFTLHTLIRQSWLRERRQRHPCSMLLSHSIWLLSTGDAVVCVMILMCVFVKG